LTHNKPNHTGPNIKNIYLVDANETVGYLKVFGCSLVAFLIRRNYVLVGMLMRKFVPPPLDYAAVAGITFPVVVVAAAAAVPCAPV